MGWTDIFSTGGSAKTDRNQVLGAYGDLNNVYQRLLASGTGLTAQGSSDTGKAGNYYSQLLSSNPTAVTNAIAPEVAGITKQVDQQKKELSQFGNRSGGTNAVAQGIQTSERGQIADVAGKARAGAAQGLAGIGESETGQGLTATGAAGTTASNLGALALDARAQDLKQREKVAAAWGDIAAAILAA